MTARRKPRLAHSPAQKPVNDVGTKTTKSRVFMLTGM